MNIKENLLITKLKKEDFEETFEVFKITIPYDFKAVNAENIIEAMEHEILQKKNILIDIINNDVPHKIFLVAKYKCKIIGTISYGPSSKAIRAYTNDKLVNVGELGSLYVLPQYHNNGVASALISAILKYLKENGIEDFCLCSGYEDAQKLWTNKFGKPYTIAKDYWADGVDNMIWYCTVRDLG